MTSKKIELSKLAPAKGSVERRKRVGRGSGSGMGKTSGKGHKGQDARTGGGTQPWFEGGGMPQYRKMPKRGFYSRKQILGKNQFNIVNLSILEKHFEAEQTVDVDSLIACGYAKNPNKKAGLKVLGTGELTKKLSVKATAVSESAKAKIEAAGGSVELV